LVDPHEQLLSHMQAGQGLAHPRHNLTGACGLLSPLSSVSGGLHRSRGAHDASSSGAISQPSALAAIAAKASAATEKASRNEAQPQTQNTPITPNVRATADRICAGSRSVHRIDTSCVVSMGMPLPV